MKEVNISYKPGKDELFNEISSKVKNYFKENGLYKQGRFKDIWFTNLLYLVIAYGSFALILNNQFNVFVMWFLSFTMGLGLSGVGLCIMHEANHGAYNKKKFINYLAGSIINIMGSHRYLWQLRHNGLHHVYTNMFDYDYDMARTFLIRHSRDWERKWYHRYQHIYALLIYFNYTLIWILVYDWIHLVEFYGKVGTKKNKAIPIHVIISIFFWKMVHLYLMIVLPYMVLDLALWQVLIGFVTMHWTLSAIIGVTFQVNHTIEGTVNIEADAQGVIQESWAKQMVKTSFNFSTKNKAVTYFLGGLNFQIEHHLFPKMSYSHFFAIKPMVKEVLEKHGYTYNDCGSWLNAILMHLKYLKRLGNGS